MAPLKLRRTGRPCAWVEILLDPDRSIAVGESAAMVLRDKDLGGLAVARRHKFRFAQLRTAPRAGRETDGIRRELEGIGSFETGQPDRTGGGMGSRTVARQRAHHSGKATGSRLIH